MSATKEDWYSTGQLIQLTSNVYVPLNSIKFDYKRISTKYDVAVTIRYRQDCQPKTNTLTHYCIYPSYSYQLRSNQI